MKRILIVEDDAAQAQSYIAALERAEWRVTWVQDIGSASAVASQADVILADRGLPDGDGVSLPGLMMEMGVDAPIILLTAVNTLDERVRGLEYGAADYVGKGLDIREIVMRCEAQLRNVRRSRAEHQELIHIGTPNAPDRDRLVIAPVERLAARESVFVTLKSKADRQRHTLEPTAFAVLRHLARNVGTTVSVTELEEMFFHRTEHTRQGVRNVISKIRRCVDFGETATFVHTYLAQKPGEQPGYVLLREPADPDSAPAAKPRDATRAAG